MDWQDVLGWGVMPYLTVPESARLRRASHMCRKLCTVYDHVVPRWCTPAHHEHLARMQHGQVPCEPQYELARRNRTVAVLLHNGDVLCLSMEMRSAPIRVTPNNTVHFMYLGARAANQHCVKAAGPDGVAVATMCSVRVYRTDDTWQPVVPQLTTTHLTSHPDTPWVYGCTEDGVYRFDPAEMRARTCFAFPGLSFAVATAQHLVVVPSRRSSLVYLLEHDAIQRQPVVLDMPGPVVDMHALRNNRVLLVCARPCGISLTVLTPSQPAPIQWTVVQIRHYPMACRWCVVGDLFLTSEAAVDLASMRVVFANGLHSVTTGICTEKRCCLFMSSCIKFFW